MQILSHRGYWGAPSDKNTLSAFERSFDHGFGTETDLRDLSGALVISHDPPVEPVTPASGMFSKLDGRDLPLALNIKADGLATMVKDALEIYSIRDAFVFDMAVPDMRSYFAAGIAVFTRLSEVEPHPVLLDKADGVWLDAFTHRWWSADDVSRVLDAGKRVCVVSPELHGRDHLDDWEELLSCSSQAGLLLCTDKPVEASKYFGVAP